MSSFQEALGPVLLVEAGAALPSGTETESELSIGHVSAICLSRGNTLKCKWDISALRDYQYPDIQRLSSDE